MLLANSIPNSNSYSVGPSATLNITNANASYTTYSNSGSVNFGNSSGTISMTSPTGGGITSTAGALLNVSAGSQGFSGPGALFKSGTGTLVLTGNSTYTGGTTLNQGTLQAGPGSSQPNGPGVGDFVWSNPANTAILDLNGQNISVGAISQSNASTSNVITNSASGTTATLTTGNNGDTTTFAGVLQNGAGTLALTTGGGVLTLTNTNTYTGDTTINGNGLLIIPHSYSLPSGPLGFANLGGTLNAGFCREHDRHRLFGLANNVRTGRGAKLDHFRQCLPVGKFRERRRNANFRLVAGVEFRLQRVDPSVSSGRHRERSPGREPP